MQHSNFLLSICIPTFNRVSYLKRTIDSIIHQVFEFDRFCVEIVVSDNCSLDATAELCKSYLRLFPDRFVYQRQLKHVQVDINFRDCLSLASGCFIKLNNDTLIHEQGSLDYMLNVLAKAYSCGSMPNRVTPFFSNGLTPHIQSSSLGLSMTEFLDQSSGISTYIGAFGIWRDDFSRIKNLFPELAWKNSLGHVDCLFRLFEMGHPVVIYNKKIATIDKPKKHGGYDIGKVFIDEYLRLCRRALSTGLLGYNSFIRETRRSIFYASDWFINQTLYPELYSFQFDGFFQRVRAACVGRPILLYEFYFRLGFVFIIKYSRQSVKRFLRFLLGRTSIA